MVLKNKKQQAISMFCFIAAAFIFGCTSTSSVPMRPMVRIMNTEEKGDAAVGKAYTVPVNQDMLAELITVLLIEDGRFKINAPFSLMKDLGMVPIHDASGPFFFSNGELYAVAMNDWSDDAKTTQWVNEYFAKLGVRRFLAVQIVPNRNSSDMTIAKDFKVLAVKQEDNTDGDSKAVKDKIKLNPQEVANTLSLFSQWEGVQFDEEVTRLTFFGSDRNQNPQISASDLIAAYEAIFVHEASGEALFVDMDFAGGESEYLVTFGGGFEDTRPGRVLLAADLLLKALSSGVDPWTSKKPLVDEVCALSPKNTFQRIFCEDVRPFVNQENRIINKKEIAQIFSLLAFIGESEGVRGVKGIIEASPSTRTDLMQEVERFGTLTVARDSYYYCKDSLRRDRKCTKDYAKLKKVVEMVFRMDHSEREFFSSMLEKGKGLGRKDIAALINITRVDAT